MLDTCLSSLCSTLFLFEYPNFDVRPQLLFHPLGPFGQRCFSLSLRILVKVLGLIRNSIVGVVDSTTLGESRRTLDQVSHSVPRGPFSFQCTCDVHLLYLGTNRCLFDGHQSRHDVTYDMLAVLLMMGHDGIVHVRWALGDGATGR